MSEHFCVICPSCNKSHEFWEKAWESWHEFECDCGMTFNPQTVREAHNAK